MTTAASLANAFAGDYLGALLDVPPVPTAIVFIAVLTLVNLRGMKESLTANLVASVIEVSGLVIVIVCAAVFFGSGNGDAGRVLEFNPDVAPLQGAFAASIVAFFSFLFARGSDARHRDERGAADAADGGGVAGDGGVRGRGDAAVPGDAAREAEARRARRRLTRGHRRMPQWRDDRHARADVTIRSRLMDADAALGVHRRPDASGRR
ncbi:hypothetical protein ACVLV4_002363 [Rathayibacter agropyri]